jgi:hypothetical protein
LNPDGDDSNTSNKKRCTGTAAVNTVSGADAKTALYQASWKDNIMNKNKKEKKERALKKEEKATRQLLVDIGERGNNFKPTSDVVIDSDTINNTDDVQKNVDPTVSVGSQSIPPCRMDYWMVREDEDKKEYSLFVCMFLDKSGVNGKNKGIMWPVIVEKIIPTLSEAKFVAREEALLQWLSDLEVELQVNAMAATVATTDE